MELDRRFAIALDGCAKAIVWGGDSSDLRRYASVFETEEGVGAIVAALAGALKRHTGGKETIRLADPTIFSYYRTAPRIYLATCLATDAPEMVREPGECLALFCLGPYQNGLSWESAATPQAIKAHRAHIDALREMEN